MDMFDLREKQMEMLGMQMDFIKQNSGLMVFGMIISIILCGLLFPYTINAWLVYSGKAAAVKFWHGALIGLIPGFGGLVILAAVVTFVALLFL